MSDEEAISPARFVDDPAWADFLPETKDVSKRRRLPTHEDCSPIDPARAAEHLAPGGTLGTMPGYEARPGQIDMLKAVANAYNCREHLLVEAGTGVGKSLAYLIPSILWAWTNDTPVVVATATRNLQSQLMDSDIPKALAVLGEEANGFKTALLKGRANYLCLRAVDEFFASGYWTMSEQEKAEMPGFIEWLKKTPDGDLDTYDGLPRNLLSCPGEECSGRRCRHHSRCFVLRARKKAVDAHLVVANHALVLSEAAGGAGSILPAYSRLVLDEAHNLEGSATDFLSATLSLESVSRILGRLLRKGRGKAPGGAGALAAIGRQLDRGILSGNAAGSRLRRLLAEAGPASLRIANAADSLLSVAARLMRPVAGADAVRFKVSGGARRYSVRGLFREYTETEWSEEELAEAMARFENELAGMVRILHDLRDTIDGATPEGEFNYLADLSSQVEGIAESLVAASNDAHFILSANRDEYAYWVERRAAAHGKRAAAYRLVAAPLSVAEDLERLLYSQKDSVVLSSATLRVGSDFAYMTRRLGCAKRFRALTAASPFDYLSQAAVFAQDSLPDPSASPDGYAAALANLLKGLFPAARARTLVLFTSYEMMNAVASRVRPELEGGGIELLVQGEGLSRESMTRALKTRDGIVLFGAQSFWEGVDVAGEALSCVVIARLPFAPAGDPIVEARCEKIEREGGSAFRDYTLPEAVIKFRQGFGRLIRSRRDRGVVVVADPRLVTKNYGAMFRRSIPASVHTVSDEEELLRRIEEFWEQ